MKKAYTIIDVLIIVVILGILAAIAVPSYRRIVRRSELKEVRTLVELARAGARYYHGKYGIDSIDTPHNLTVLNVTVPDNAVCTYSIVDLGYADRRWLQVDSSGTWLYRYELPEDDTPGDNINGANPDARYVQDLPH